MNEYIKSAVGLNKLKLTIVVVLVLSNLLIGLYWIFTTLSQIFPSHNILAMITYFIIMSVVGNLEKKYKSKQTSQDFNLSGTFILHNFLVLYGLYLYTQTAFCSIYVVALVIALKIVFLAKLPKKLMKKP